MSNTPPSDEATRNRKAKVLGELQAEFDVLSSGALLWSSRANSTNYATSNLNFDKGLEPSCLSYFYFHRNLTPGERIGN